MPVQSETFLHVFFNCVYSEKYRNKVESELFPELRNASNDDRKHFWMYCIMPQMNKPNIFISCIVSTTNYMIWEMKLRKDTVSTGTFILDLKLQIVRILQLSGKIREAKHAEPFFACRHTYDPP